MHRGKVCYDKSSLRANAKQSRKTVITRSDKRRSNPIHLIPHLEIKKILLYLSQNVTFSHLLFGRVASGGHGSYQCLINVVNRLCNKCAMTCFANMNQNIFNDKDFSLKRAGATHVALCDSVGSYFRHWCAAFTLAEVLITLGIIGVVAAMTMPTLIANYQKQVATTRLKKFYTTYSQAYNQSKNDNYDIDGADILKNGLNSTQMMDWYDTYLRPYFKTVRADKTKYGVEVAFPDGSGMLIEKDGCAAGTVCTHVVYCVQYKYCEEIKDKGHIYLLPDAKHTFLFYTSGVPSEVYEYKEDGSMVGLTNYDRETALTSCKKGKRNCTRLLYMDNWEIKKDYPWWN